jgi:hypothetical protein
MSSLPVKRLRNDRAPRRGIALVAWMVALSVVAPVVAQPVEPNGTPRPAGDTPRPLATPLAQAEDTGGVGSRLVAQQSAAQATIAAYATRVTVQATRIAALQAAIEAQRANAQVTATALAVVAANSVLDPERQSMSPLTDLGGMLNGDARAREDARAALSGLLARYPPGCRAGFMLISGHAPTIPEGIALAQSVDAVLREVWPDIFPEATGAEFFALPNEEPFGQVDIDIFFYSGCEPVG